MSTFKVKADTPAKEGFMSQEEKIKRGQAFNLAVAAAIHEGKPTEAVAILSYFFFYIDLGKITSTYSIDEMIKYVDEIKGQKP